MSDISNVIDKIKRFRDEREWKQFHNSKNMAISIVIEATELLEHFQWRTKEEVENYVKQNKEEIEEEVADIAIYLFEFADNTGVNIIESIEKKLKKNALKYPVGKSKGNSKKYNKL